MEIDSSSGTSNWLISTVTVAIATSLLAKLMMCENKLVQLLIYIPSCRGDYKKL